MWLCLPLIVNGNIMKYSSRYKNFKLKNIKLSKSFRHDTRKFGLAIKHKKSCKVSLLLSFPNMHYLYVIVIDISSSFVSSLHASFLYGTQDGKICFVFFLVILKDATSVWRGKYFDVGGYFRFVIVQVNYDKYEWVPFSPEIFDSCAKLIQARMYQNWIIFWLKVWLFKMIGYTYRVKRYIM